MLRHLSERRWLVMMFGLGVALSVFVVVAAMCAAGS